MVIQKNTIINYYVHVYVNFFTFILIIERLYEHEL